MRDASSSSSGGRFTDSCNTKERCHSVTAQYHEFSNDDSESSNDDSDFELQHVPPKQQSTRCDPVVAVNNETPRKNRRMIPKDASEHTRSHTTTIVAKRGRGRPRKPQSLKSLKKALSSSSGGPVWTEVSAVSHVFCDEIQTYLLTTKNNLSEGQVECLERVSQAVETRLEQHNEIVIENIKVAREASASQRQVKHLRDDLLVCSLRLKKYREEHFALQQSSQQQQTATHTALRASRFLTALQNLASPSSQRY